MKEILNVTHPVLTIGQLQDKIRKKRTPVRRSTHAGNQTARELVLQCHMPAGIDILAVDTISAGDDYSNPRVIRLDGREIPLSSKKSASLIVGSAVVREDIESIMKGELLAHLPKAGKRIIDVHMHAAHALKPANPMVLMSEFFARNPDLYQAIIEAAVKNGEDMRHIESTGKTRPSDTVTSDGIFGLNDATPAHMGIAPSLNSMMALDMLISSSQGSMATTHLGGRDMLVYTRDAARMQQVGTLLGRAAADVGISISPHHHYEVVDVTNLNRLVAPSDYTSQHELLRSREIEHVNLTRSCSSVTLL